MEIKLSKKLVEETFLVIDQITKNLQFQSINMTQFGDPDIWNELDEIVNDQENVKDRLKGLYDKLMEKGYWQ